MTSHHTLDSEKYFTQSLVADHKVNRRKQMANLGNTISSLFLFASLCLSLYIAYSLMPHWSPAVETWFHEMTRYQYFK